MKKFGIETRHVITWIISVTIAIITTLLITSNAVANSTIEAFGNNLVETLVAGFEAIVNPDMHYEEAIEAIEEEARALRNKVATLENDVATLENEKKLIQNDLDILQATYERYQALTSRVAVKYEANEQLRVANVSLMSENTSLVSERDILRQQLADVVNNDSVYQQAVDTETARTPMQFWETVPPFEQSRTRVPGFNVLVAGNPISDARTFQGRDGVNGVNSQTRHNLNEQYSILRANVGRLDGSRMVRSTLTFTGDGRELYIREIGVYDMPRPIEIDLTGVSQLIIRHDGNSNVMGAGLWNEASVAIFDAWIE